MKRLVRLKLSSSSPEKILKFIPMKRYSNPYAQPRAKITIAVR